MTRRNSHPGERCICGRIAIYTEIFTDGTEHPVCGLTMQQINREHQMAERSIRRTDNEVPV